jgi:teichuronic acid biosynthesis glycosyltransferase TuaC
MSRRGPIRTLLFSTLYPSSARPGHGIFVETRLRELLATGDVETRVVAPVPWFFSTHPRYGEHASLARTPLRETRHGVDVMHPRYFLPPRVGMNVAPFFLAAGAAPAIKRLIREGYDFDMIDAHYYYPDGVAAALLAKWFKRPLVVTARGSDINLIANHLLPRRLMLWASRIASASIGVSGALTAKMANLGMDANKVATLRNGVDLQKFRPIDQQEARSQLGWPEQLAMISVGNLVENKGHQIAIEALTQLPAVRLVIVGEGPERAALQNLAERLGVDARVAFAGRVEPEKLHVWYSAADMLVLPSSREGWPNVLLEALACGTPVVATSVGGIPEIVNSQQIGRLMAARSSEALVAAVQALLSNPPAHRQLRAFASQFSWQATTNAQLDLFERIRAKPSGARNA